ncbi:glycosyltransferase family 9 protein, partial [Klebsiella pneumoniae]|nr:lipopolysaccharide heptosyltransferase 1 [Klebsiella pneumoniae]MCP6001299.1 lipopolysaccharide heptosyltransferase 1 [Klebsiella pneumoniae]
ALDKPNFTLYGPTDPGLIGGYGKNQHTLISPTKETKDISATTIMQAIQEVI